MSEIALAVLEMPDELFWADDPLYRNQHNACRKEAAAEIRKLRAIVENQAEAGAQGDAVGVLDEDGEGLYARIGHDDLKRTGAKVGDPVYLAPPAPAIPEGWREIIEAVAHIGVDLGYGKFELNQEHIERARELLSAAPDKQEVKDAD